MNMPQVTNLSYDGYSICHSVTAIVTTNYFVRLKEKTMISVQITLTLLPTSDSLYCQDFNENNLTHVGILT